MVHQGEYDEKILRFNFNKFSDSNIGKFMIKNNILEYKDLLKKSVENINWYWDSVNEDLGLEWFENYTQTYDSSKKGIQKTDWFIGGKCNIISNAIDRHLKTQPDKIAFIFENEEGKTRKISYRELDYHVSALALALKNEGIKKGDVVGIYLPMVPEAIFSIFACSKIGAIHNTIFSGFSKDALVTRLDDSKAKILITINQMERRGKKIDLQENWYSVIEKPAISKIVLVDGKQVQLHLDSVIEKLIDYKTFVSNYYERYCETEVMTPSDPLFILYTSGTTGKPKAVVHSHGGFMIVSAQQTHYVIDMKKEDVLFWYADIGWITGQTWVVYGSTIIGGTSVIYDGILSYPKHDRWCDIIEKYNVSIFGIAPTAIRLFMKDNENGNYIDNHKFHKLRVLTTTGEAINQEAWTWYHNKVGRRKCPIINLSGGTEIGGAILSTTVLDTSKPCSIGFPIPGFDAAIFDDYGKETKNGYLVIRKPWPSMTIGLLNDWDRFIDTYWSKYQNNWFHGDIASIDGDGYWYIKGRADDVIKISGHRIESNEIESILMSHSSVAEAVVVGIPDAITGEAIACYVVLNNKNKIPNDRLNNELFELIENNLGRFAKPKYVTFVNDLPKTRTGKLVRRLVKQKALNSYISETDLSAIENPESLLSK